MELDCWSSKTLQFSQGRCSIRIKLLSENEWCACQCWKSLCIFVSHNRCLFLLFDNFCWDVWSVPTMLYLASILVGLAHGAHWTLMVATSSELFGLKNFGALYNTLRFGSLSFLLLGREFCRCWLDPHSKCLARFYQHEFPLWRKYAYLKRFSR